MAEEDKDRRERAYHLWEAEGRPEGRAEAHWDMAVAPSQEGGQPSPETPSVANESGHATKLGKTPKGKAKAKAAPKAKSHKNA